MEDFIGTIKLFAGNKMHIPEGWKLCNGEMLNKDEYAVLFKTISYRYGGSGDLFALPQLNRNVAIGAANNDELGKTLGSPTTIIEKTNLPRIDGIVNVQRLNINGNITGRIEMDIEIPCNSSGTGFRSNNPANNYLSINDASDGSSNANIFSNNADSKMAKFRVSKEVKSSTSVMINEPFSFSTSQFSHSDPINIMQPSLALYYIICVSGLFYSGNDRRVLLPTTELKIQPFNIYTSIINAGSSSSKKKVVRIDNPFHASGYGIMPLVEVKNTEMYSDVFATSIVGDFESEYFEVAICRIDGDSWAQDLSLTVVFNIYSL